MFTVLVPIAPLESVAGTVIVRCPRRLKVNGVREYWLVDPRRREITVLARGTAGRFVIACAATGQRPARSTLLPGFAVRPCDVFP